MLKSPCRRPGRISILLPGMASRSSLAESRMLFCSLAPATIMAFAVVSDSSWDSISAFVMTLAHGGGNFYDGWMNNPKSAMISCNDGFRPVSFYLEALDEEVE